MNEADALDLARSAILTVLIASGPPVACCMIIGLAISLLQALTQVQEQTLTFVPKMLTIMVVLAIASTFIGGQIGAFTQNVYGHIATGF